MDNAITEAVNAITEEAIPSMSKINMSAMIIRATDITFINIAIIVLSFFILYSSSIIFQININKNNT